MKFGLSEANFDLVVTEIATPLKNMGVEVYVFGSRARGDYSEFSDLDIMVEGEANVDILIASIIEKFQKSNFPIKIDIVKSKDFAESYRSSYLKERIRL